MSIPRQKLLFMCILGSFLACPDAPAEDKLYTHQGGSQAGRITHVDGDGVWMDLGGAQSKFARTDISRVEIPVPDAANEGFKLYQDGKYAAAIAKIEPVVKQYEGLPQDWIEQAGYILAKCYLKTRDFTRALDCFGRAQKYYQDSPRISTAISGVAQAQFGLKNEDAAARLLEPLVAEREKLLDLSDIDKEDMGCAFLTLGKCYHSKGEKEKALECFLKVIALYYTDPSAVSEATYWSGIEFEAMNNLQRAVGQYKDFLKAAADSPLADDVKKRLQKLETTTSQRSPS